MKWLNFLPLLVWAIGFFLAASHEERADFAIGKRWTDDEKSGCSLFLTIGCVIFLVIGICLSL